MIPAACPRQRAERSQHGPLLSLLVLMPLLSALPEGLCSQHSVRIQLAPLVGFRCVQVRISFAFRRATVSRSRLTGYHISMGCSRWC